MTDVIYDSKTKKMLTPKKKAGAAKAVRGYISINQDLLNTLAGFADEDGIETVAESAMGRKVRTTNAVRLYVEVAIKEFIAARAGGEDEGEEGE